jgi:hypothetical protein
MRLATRARGADVAIVLALARDPSALAVSAGAGSLLAPRCARMRAAALERERCLSKLETRCAGPDREQAARLLAVRIGSKPKRRPKSMTTKKRSNGVKTYARAAQRKVGQALHEVKAGAMRSLKSKKTKAAARQLIATAVSEAMRVEKDVERRVLRKKRLRTHSARTH